MSTENENQAGSSSFHKASCSHFTDLSGLKNIQFTLISTIRILQDDALEDNLSIDGIWEYIVDVYPPGMVFSKDLVAFYVLHRKLRD